MNRPYTGAMQFEGELEPGLYLTANGRVSVGRAINALEDAAEDAESVVDSLGEDLDEDTFEDAVLTIKNRLSDLRELLHVNPLERPQRAELKD